MLRFALVYSNICECLELIIKIWSYSFILNIHFTKLKKYIYSAVKLRPFNFFYFSSVKADYLNLTMMVYFVYFCRRNLSGRERALGT